MLCVREKIMSTIYYTCEHILCCTFQILKLAYFSLFISSHRFEHKEQIRPSCGLADQKESYHVSPRKGAMDSR